MTRESLMEELVSVDDGADWGALYLEFIPPTEGIRMYEPSDSMTEKPNFLDRVKATEFCNSTYIHLEGSTYEKPKVRKVIELTKNEEHDKVFTVIERTRLCIGNLKEETECGEFGSIISTQRYLDTERWFHVYILSDGFGKRWTALADHLEVLPKAPESTEPHSEAEAV